MDIKYNEVNVFLKIMNKQKRLTRILIPFLIFILISIGVFFLILRDKDLKLENFYYLDNNGHVQIDITDGEYAVIILTFQIQPKSIESVVNQALGNKKYDYITSNKKGLIDIRLKEDVYNQPTILIVKDTKKGTYGYMELLRQSAKYLNQYFKFNKTSGYTIVARTSIKLPIGHEYVRSDMTYFIPSKRPYPPIIKYYPKEKYEPEIKEAIGLMRYLWSEPINVGPTDEILDDQYGVLKRVELLRNGEWSTQCADFRNLFNNLALRSNIIMKIRRVELRQYFPPFEDLISNAHSISEIFVKKLNKWIAIDPWNGYLFTLDGQFINADEIARLPKETYQKINIERYVSPKKTLIDQPYGNVLNDIILTHGYFSYFGSIEYGPDRTQSSYNLMNR